MFGLTKREQRWKAEREGMKVIMPLLAEMIKAAVEIRVAEAQAAKVMNNLPSTKGTPNE